MSEALDQGPAGRDDARRLTAAHAAERGDRVRDPDYVLSLDLDTQAAEYAGHLRLSFHLASARLPLTLDFSGGCVRTLSVNGESCAVDHNGAFLTIPAGVLRMGGNTVEVAYTQAYDEGGAGLHRLTDDADGRVYVYSHFEPYDANRVFPCFDQPDIKGRFELTVTAPADWVVVSAVRERSVTADGDRKRWQFPVTPRISTYLFSLHGGPYQVHEDRAGDIPLRLLTRRSMAAHVDADQWFGLMKTGFAWFQDYFAVPYPYDKYDSIVVPDFNIGAMENVGAVTYSEAYVSRGEPTRRDARRLADVVLHEMSHMWFGNLVTMPWWDGLWLKESFATYMAQKASDEAAGFAEVWHAFCIEAKERARRADMAVTTHPVDVPVPDTRDAFAQFDAITYNKGASALAQLAHYVGADAFRDGVRAYLAGHAGGTATLADLVDALAAATDRPLDGWIDEWMQRSGMSTLRVRMTIDDGRIAAFAIEQQATDAQPTLRRHRIQVALYRSGPDGRLVADAPLPVTVAGPLTDVPDLVGRPAPDLVCPNAGDWGFAAFDPDPVTLSHLPARLGEVPEPLQRSLFLQALWDRLREGRLSIDDFLTVSVERLETDSDELVCRQAFAYVQETLEVMAGADTAHPSLDRVTVALERITWSRMQASGDDGDRARFWLDSHLDVVISEQAQTRLASLLGRDAAGGVPFDADRRWMALIALSGGGFPGAGGLVAAERRRDGSDRAAKMALAADAAWPQAEVKARWLGRLANPDDTLGLSRQRHVMRHLFPRRQAALHRQFAGDILSPLSRLGRRCDAAFLSAWVTMLPVLSDAGTRGLLAAALGSADRLHPVLDRGLREAVEEADRRNIMIHAT